MTPARRSPDGYVAQRLWRNNQPVGPRGPWVLTYLNVAGDLAVKVLTDDEIADWPELHALDEFDAMRARARDWLNQDVDSGLYVGVAADRVAAERLVARQILGEDADDRDGPWPCPN